MSAWSNHKALQVPLHESIHNIIDLPYTISYVIRKHMQVDSLNELPKEKRPPDSILWDGTSEELTEWLDSVLDRKKKPDGLMLSIGESEIEG
jgi:hypothetical protein